MPHFSKIIIDICDNTLIHFFFSSLSTFLLSILIATWTLIFEWIETHARILSCYLCNSLTFCVRTAMFGYFMVGFSIHMGVKSVPFCACARKWGISMQVNSEKRYLLLREKEETKKGFHRERRDCVGITWEKSRVPMLSYVL